MGLHLYVDPVNGGCIVAIACKTVGRSVTMTTANAILSVTVKIEPVNVD
jgi:hypothetical protein